MESVKRYTRKPTEVLAIQYTGAESAAAISRWAGSFAHVIFSDETEETVTGVIVLTPTGTARLSLNDWIVRDSNWDWTAVKGNVFTETYEEVKDD